MLNFVLEPRELLDNPPALGNLFGLVARGDGPIGVVNGLRL